MKPLLFLFKGNQKMKVIKNSDCRKEIVACGKDAALSAKEAELDSKFITIGSLLTIIAGAFTSVYIVGVGVGIIIIGEIIFLYKRLLEILNSFKIGRNKYSN